MCFALNKGASLIKECAQALQKLEPNLIPVALFEFLTKLYRFLNCKLSLSFSKVIYGMERVCVCVCFSKSSFTGYHLTFTFSGKTLTFIYWHLIFFVQTTKQENILKVFVKYLQVYGSDTLVCGLIFEHIFALPYMQHTLL